MNKIVIDLEFTRVDADKKGVQKVCQFEVIQIGAVKLNDEDDVVDRFDMYVKPRYSHIDPIVERLTGISNDMVKHAPSFNQALVEFMRWIGNEEYTVFSWGNDDLVVMKRECKLCAIDSKFTKKLFESWINLQALVGRMLDVNKQLSLEKTLNAGNIEITGRLHCAVDDAENTAKIYKFAQRDEENFIKTVGDRIDIVEEEEDYKETNYSSGEMTYSLAGLLEGLAINA